MAAVVAVFSHPPKVTGSSKVINRLRHKTKHRANVVLVFPEAVAAVEAKAVVETKIPKIKASPVPRHPAGA